MCTSTPNWSAWLEQAFGGGGTEFALDLFYRSPNLVTGTNPPYTLQDFLAMYPKFGGLPLVVSATTVSGSPNVALTSSTGMKAGNPVSGAGIPNGTFILSVTDSGNIVLTQNASASGAVQITVWNAPPIPFAVVSAYLAMALASLVFNRWQELWTGAVALYVAHFLTLYARSDGNPLSTIGQIAAQGIVTGIQIAKAVGDVSVSYQPVPGLEIWGAWNLTTYGQQLVTFAKFVGSESALIR